MTFVRTIERDCRDKLGEGPLWSAQTGALYWTDILAHNLNRLTVGSDKVDTWHFPEYLGWVIERESGGLIAGLGRRFVQLNLDTGSIEPVADPEPHRAGNRVNDAKADCYGRIWAGTMSIEGDGETGGFYRLDVDGTVTRVDDGYRIANGPAISPDGRSLFHTDTAIGTIFRFAINDDGSLGKRTPFIEFEEKWGHPDGMTLDADGCLWVACWGAGCVTRFSPDGKRDRSIALPASQITSCTFAGPMLDRMFVTSASVGTDELLGGALFEIDPGCLGLETQIYRG